ncbi:MAG TPA: TonB-dependent receptor, partial [Vicingus sp.]|nr:TonB-dependent receptor [Vicingus sp.]
NQNSVYGNIPYLAQQNIAFGQVYWDKKIKELHRLTIGTALRYNYYDDNSVATQTSDSLNPINKPEQFWLPGFFAQDEFYLNEKNKLLLGIRLDHDSRHGYITTPRLNYKWSPSDQQHIRLSFGTGYRVVNLFTMQQ